MKFDLVKIFGFVLQAMQIVEKIKTAKGEEKLKAVSDSTEEFIEQLEGLAGKELINQTEVKKAFEAAVSAIKAFMNAVKTAQNK